jgi:hypothetical protein
VVRSESRPGQAGITRYWWDLRHEPTREVALRTTPPGNKEVWREKRFAGRDTRSIAYYGIDVPKRGPLVPPGAYTVRVKVDGKELVETLTVLKDPNTKATDADVVASTRLAMDAYRQTNDAVDAINRVEWTRRQFEDLRKMTAGRPDAAALDADIEAIDVRYREQEDRLLHPSIAEGDLKSFRGAMGLYLKWLWLQAEVGTGGGDVAGNSDFAPTQPQLEVYELMARQMTEVQSALRALDEGALQDLDRTLRDKGLPRFVLVAPSAMPAGGTP